MARNPQIRITKNDRTEYAKLAKNSKSKVKRTQKNYGIDLSNEIEIPSLDSFQTRKEFNEWKEKQSSFTNRNNTRFQFKKNVNNVPASVFELREAEKNYKEAKRNADKERTRLEQKSVVAGGKVRGTQAQAGLIMKKPKDVRIAVVEPFDFNNYHSRKGLENRFQKLKERASGEFYDKRMQQMKENWLDAVAGSFNSDADEIIDRIKFMPLDDFYELYLLDQDVMNFEIYDSKGQMVDATDKALNKIRGYLDKYDSGELSFDLKNVPNR